MKDERGGVVGANGFVVPGSRREDDQTWVLVTLHALKRGPFHMILSPGQSKLSAA